LGEPEIVDARGVDVARGVQIQADSICGFVQSSAIQELQPDQQRNATDERGYSQEADDEF
jgi:hypothetical protein